MVVLVHGLGGEVGRSGLVWDGGMIVYPLTPIEKLVVCWTIGIMVLVSVSVLLTLG